MMESAVRTLASSATLTLSMSRSLLCSALPGFSCRQKGQVSCSAIQRRMQAEQKPCYVQLT